MAYVFQPLDKHGKPLVLKRDLVYLTRSDRQKASTAFCVELQGYGINAWDFDLVKDEFCRVRNDKDCAGFVNKPFCSVDCLFVSKGGKCYFIEFKKSTAEKLSENYEGKPIAVSLRHKAIDSLAVALLTVLNSRTATDVTNRAEYIVVYRPSVENTCSTLRFNEQLTRLSNRVKTASPIMWELDALQTCGLFHTVRTLPENQFVSWAKSNLFERP